MSETDPIGGGEEQGGTFAPDRESAAEIERYAREVIGREVIGREALAREALAAGDGTAGEVASPAASLDALLPAIYAEMRTLAAYILRGEGVGRTLRPTALAHEAYLRLARQTRFAPENQRHLLAVAATMMRRVLVDSVRERKAAKRGGAAERVTLGRMDEEGEGEASAAGERSRATAAVDLIDLHRALDRLAAEHPRKARVVELLYLAGLTQEEAGSVLGITARTVLRDWMFARAWLWKELSGEDAARAPQDPPRSIERSAGNEGSRESGPIPPPVSRE
ncbi:MAG: ECF-type sigma factor [Candidatus Eisenbacteria bacterium]